MQALEDLGHRQGAHPRRCQLDRQRHPIQAPANLPHGRCVVTGHGKAGLGQAGTVGEQLDGCIGSHQASEHGPVGQRPHAHRGSHLGVRLGIDGGDRAAGSQRPNQQGPIIDLACDRQSLLSLI
jgi:hypothetical protein